MTLFDLVHALVQFDFGHIAHIAAPGTSGSTIPLSTDSLYKVFIKLKDTSSQTGGRLVDVAYGILGAGVAYRIIRAWLESALYGDAMEVINEAIQTLVVAGLIGLTLHNYAALNTYTWRLGESAMAFMDGAGAGGAGDKGADPKNALDQIWQKTLESIGGVFNAAITSSNECDKKYEKFDENGKPVELGFTDAVKYGACKTAEMASSLAGTILGMPFILVTVIVLLIFGVLMMYQVLRAFVQVAVGLIWLPFTLGFYFFIDSWFRNAVAMITGGLANMAMITLILEMVLSSIGEAIRQIETSSVITSSLSKAGTLVMLMIFIMALTMMSNSVLTFGSQIFGVPTGGDRLRGPAGKSGGGGGPTPKDGGEGNTPPNSEGAKLAPPNPPSPSPIAMSSQSANAGASLGTAAKAAALAAGTVATGGAGAAVGAAGAAGGAGAGAAAGTAGGAGAAAGGTGAAASGASAGGTGGAGVTGGVGGAGGGTPPTGVVSGGPKDGGSVVSGGQKGGSSAKGFASSAYSKASQGVQRISASPAGRLAAGYGRYAAKTSEAALRFWLAQTTHGFDSKINFTSRKPPQKKE